MEAFRLRFASPVRVDAGFDRNVEALTGFGMLGPGHAGNSSIVLEARLGNPGPRGFQFPAIEVGQNSSVLTCVGSKNVT